MMKKTKTLSPQNGFTLVELTLAIAFLGSLVLLSSSIIISTINVYNKGVAIKQINQAGRALAEDITRLTSRGSKIEVADHGRAGYLCVKESNAWRSYTWNSIERGEGTTPVTDIPDAARRQYTLASQPISLVRSNDGIDGYSYCSLPQGSDVGLPTDKVTPLLTDQVRILSVDIVSSNDPALRKIAFWIGTYDSSGTVPNMTPEYIAATPTESAFWRCKGGSLGDFCAVSKFETVIYTPNVEGW